MGPKMVDQKFEKPNLDLIGLVQKARMEHDAQAQPSQIYGVYWIEAKPTIPGPRLTSRVGQWVIVTTLEDVDAMWERIKQATVAGKLGYKSVVATASHDATKQAMRLIYIRTYDAEDTADVNRVRSALRELGIEGDLTYARKNG
jgi:hypothetical protein